MLVHFKTVCRCAIIVFSPLESVCQNLLANKMSEFSDFRDMFGQQVRSFVILPSAFLQEPVGQSAIGEFSPVLIQRHEIQLQTAQCQMGFSCLFNQRKHIKGISTVVKNNARLQSGKLTLQVFFCSSRLQLFQLVSFPTSSEPVSRFPFPLACSAVGSRRMPCSKTVSLLLGSPSYPKARALVSYSNL